MKTLFIAAALALAAGNHRRSCPSTEQMLAFNSMYGVEGAFIDNTTVRGVLGDELPWDVGAVRGSLTVGGHLQLHVTGVVFSNAPSVPQNLRGINDETSFRALVSCITEQNDKLAISNVMTAGFSANRMGDSHIDAFLKLPQPCVAPVVFVMSGSENKWFAVTGGELE